MARIAREQENTPDLVNFFTRVSGALVDVYAMEFRIERIEDEVPGPQVFPESGWEDISAAPGHYDTGWYYAYDNTAGRGWMPAAGSAVGTHRVYWRWKQFETSSWTEREEDIEVTEELPTPADTYITIGDVREAGLTDPPFTNAMIEAAIVLWQQALERACRQWFDERELTILFDGNDRDTLHLGVPIIEIEYLKLNRMTDPLDAAKYKVYNSRTYPDDRHNPKIRLVHSTQLSDIYVAPWSIGELRFVKGYQNQEIKGTFGFVEPDGSTPALIKRALLKLVVEKLTHPFYVAPDAEEPVPSAVTYAGVVISETTDGHSIRYGSSSFAERRSGLSGLTQDPEILDIIKLYRAPIGIATPSAWSF